MLRESDEAAPVQASAGAVLPRYYQGTFPFYSGGDRPSETMVARSTGVVAASGDTWVLQTRS